MTKTRRARRRYYSGAADGSVFVTTAGGKHRLNPRFDLRKHSPTGFSWGYNGSGPTQLALALAADILGDDERAERIYQLFKARFVSHLPFDKPWGPLPAAELRLTLAEIEFESGSNNAARCQKKTRTRHITQPSDWPGDTP